MLRYQNYQKLTALLGKPPEIYVSQGHKLKFKSIEDDLLLKSYNIKPIRTDSVIKEETEPERSGVEENFQKLFIYRDHIKFRYQFEGYETKAFYYPFQSFFFHNPWMDRTLFAIETAMKNEGIADNIHIVLDKTAHAKPCEDAINGQNLIKNFAVTGRQDNDSDVWTHDRDLMVF